MTATVNWIIGPHLLGIIYLIIGCIQYYFPPKRINNLYGYRLPSAQKNQETWDEANRYSAVYMIKVGFVVIGFGLIITIMMITVPMPANIRELATIMLFMLSGMVPPLFMIVATEKHLTKLFGDK